MFRNVMNDLATWYETGADKIAVVRGGKFVGKTWAVADFAMGFFEDHIIIDMDKYPDFAAYAAKERRPEKLHAKLTTSLDKYDFKDKLLIFDNAQNCVGLLGNLIRSGLIPCCKVIHNISKQASHLDSTTFSKSIIEYH